jgi:hypothetical protein
MVVSGTVQCATCAQNYFVRIGMGSESYQEHSFDCTRCTLPTTLALRKVEGGGRIEVEENGRVLDEVVADSTVINLHGSFAFDAATIHDRLAFPSLMYLQVISPHVRRATNDKFQDFALLFDVPNTRGLWGMVRGVLTLEAADNDNRKVARLIEEYLRQRRKYFPELKVSNSQEMVFNFFDSIFYPRFEKLLNPVLTCLVAAEHANPDGYTQLVAYLNAELWPESLRQNLSLFSDYFRLFTEFSQMLVHARLDDQEVAAKIVGSKHFERTKLFYGQAFETLTSGFTVLSCINNLLAGRNFDEFEELTLRQYLREVSKARRDEPFQNRPELHALAQHVDSTLRNGSHHASIWREGELVKYRSGGAGAQREMPYSQYLHLCNHLAIACSVLLVLGHRIQMQ